MYFIGIDLAWTYKNESGICVINDKGEIRYWCSKVYSNEELADIVEEFSDDGAVVGIDAPLIVNNEGGSRECDRLIMKNKIHGKRLFVFNCSRSFLLKTYGHIRGEEVVSAIQKRNKNFKIIWDKTHNNYSIFETFPTGICLGLFPEAFPIKYKLKNKVPFPETKKEMARIIDLLKGLSNDRPAIIGLEHHLKDDVTTLNRKEMKHLEDKIDAFLCAYSGFWCYRNQGKELVLGDDKEGFIVLPVIDNTRVVKAVVPAFR